MPEQAGQPKQYRVVFSGRLDSAIPPHVIRESLLRFYKGNHMTVERFFAGRALVIKKNSGHAEAMKCMAMFEKAGALCRLEEEHDAGTVTEAEKPSAAVSPWAAKPAARMAGRTVEAPVLKGSSLQNGLAAVMILLLIVSVAARIFALNRAHGIYPPDLVTANATGVCVHADGKLFFLSPAGVLQKRISLHERGITQRAADIELLKDGGLLIGLKGTGEIVRCGGAEFACRKIGPPAGYQITDNFRILADEERDRLFIADTNGGRLMVQSMEGLSEGSSINQIAENTQLSFPSGMTLDDRGLLWVSSTARGEVVAYAQEDGLISETGEVIRIVPDSAAEMRDLKKMMERDPKDKPPTVKDLIEMIGSLKKAQDKIGEEVMQSRPLSVAWDSHGRLWVVASDGLITTSGIRIFNPDGTPLQRLQREKGSLPLDLSASGDKILIADSGLFRVSSVDTGTNAAGVFGDQGFLQELESARNELLKYKAIARWSGLGILLLVLGTVVLVVAIAVNGYRRRNSGSANERIAHRAAAVAAGESPLQVHAAPTRHSLFFTGSGSEYFRIWIVNTFLTIVTLGIYAAWAKVRTRRYFYRNTLLDGHPFDYTADPVSIFRGYVIVGSGLLVYSLVKAFQPMYTLAVIAVFAPFIPFLIFKSLRFYTHNSVYRNIRFRFLGSLGESYRTYLLYPLLIPFTLGLIVPYWEFRRKKYFFDNVAYGSEGNSFRGAAGPFYSIYVLSSLIMLAIIFVFGIAAAILIPAVARAGILNTGATGSGFIVSILAGYLVLLLLYSFVQMYLYAGITNYCFNHSELGRVRFESTLSSGRLFWIRISNIAAIVLSLGLLLPWAKVRRMKYVVDNLIIVSGDDLGVYTSAVEAEQSSYGDVATGFFDFEVGL